MPNAAVHTAVASCRIPIGTLLLVGAAVGAGFVACRARRRDRHVTGWLQRAGDAIERWDEFFTKRAGLSVPDEKL